MDSRRCEGDEQYEARAISSWAQRTKRTAAPEHYPSSLPVTALAVASSNDAIEIWTSGYGEALKWSVHEATAKLTARLPTAGEHLSDIELSFDGKLMAVASGTPGTQGFVEVFSLSDDKRELMWSHACQDLPADTAFAPHQNKLAIGHSGRYVLIANLEVEPSKSIATQVFHRMRTQSWL